jgi:ubiquinone/menaquinone biosynthesis C-methylase UbiE
MNIDIDSLEERKRKEIEHTDRRRSIVKGHEYLTDVGVQENSGGIIADETAYAEHFSNMKFYSISRSSFAYRDKRLYENIKGKEALDYCCGNGEIALEMARLEAAQVHGIDISQVAVDNANELAQKEGVSERCVYSVMDAEQMTFDNDKFDVIHEYGALHHLDLQAALKELSRVLKPGGRLVCTEALRHNPFIHWYRNRTPHLRTQWEVEHILGVPEIMSGKQYFGNVDVRFFHLAVLAAVPFRKTKIFKPLLSCLEAVDSVLTRLPGIRRWAWIAVIVYTEPRK